MRIGGIERAMCEFRGLRGDRSRKRRSGSIYAQRGAWVLRAAVGTANGAGTGAGADAGVDVTANIAQGGGVLAGE